ncbi:MAG: hypothetical protein AAFY12_11715 [Pseudomonadota bacterium]
MNDNMARLLAYIERYRDAHGKSPTHDEMRNAMGWANKSYVNQALINMDRLGFLRRIPGKPRSIYATRSGLQMIQTSEAANG